MRSVFYSIENIALRDSRTLQRKSLILMPRSHTFFTYVLN